MAEATELAEEGMEAAGDAGNRQAQAWLAYPHGVAQAHLGHADRRPTTRHCSDPGWPSRTDGCGS